MDATGLSPRSEIPGSPVALGCPDCGGGMFEARSPGGAPHFVCHVGHSWSPESLMDAQREATESSLYGAAAKLREEAMVLRRIAGLRAPSAAPAEVSELESRADQAQQRALQIEAMVRNDR